MFSKLAQLSKANEELTRENAELREKLASFEKRAAAEDFLMGIKEDPGSPVSLRPLTPEDFLEKRAALEQHDNLKSAALAVKLAKRQDFEIGDVADENPKYQTGENQADAILTNWLAEAL